MKTKLVCFDVDGTLIHSDGGWSLKNENALKAARKKGVLPVINSGRSYYELPRQARECGAFAYFICSNGAVIADEQGKLLEEFPIPAALCRACLDVLQRTDAMIEIYRDGIPFAESRFLSEEAWDYFQVKKSYYPVMHDSRRGVAEIRRFFEEKPDSTEMFNIFFRHPEQREACFAQLSEIPGIKLTTSMENNMEIFSREADKGNALLALCRRLGIDPAQSAALGDSRNDIPMLLAAGTGAAVANACPQAKEAAKLVTVSCDDDAAAALLDALTAGEDERIPD